MMTTELMMLALSVVLGFVHITASTIATTAQYGKKWNLGPRDAQMPRLQVVPARLQRALQNFLETFPLFVAAVLIADATNRHGPLTVWGSQLYFWARVVYLPIYALGISGVRTLVWIAASGGIAMILFGLL